MDISATDATIIVALIAVLANLATAANFFFAKKQLKLSGETIGVMEEQLKLLGETINLSRDAINEDHKRSRLMLSLETCREWNRSLDRDVVDARRLLASLEASACKNVAESSSSPPEIIEISNKGKFPLVESCLAGAPSDTPFFKRESEDKIVITTAGVKQLRHLGVRYLKYYVNVAA